MIAAQETTTNKQTRQAEPLNTVDTQNIVHIEAKSHGAEAERRQESSEEDSAEQQPSYSIGVHIRCHSRIKALKDEMRAIKVLNYSRIQEQSQKYRKKMVE